MTKRTYKVLIVVKDGWWSDQEKFDSFGAAVRHQRDIARKWNTSETAIGQGERVLNFRKREKFLAEIAALRVGESKRGGTRCTDQSA
jgi:hypothetical protein